MSFKTVRSGKNNILSFVVVVVVVVVFVFLASICNVHYTYSLYVMLSKGIYDVRLFVGQANVNTL